MLLALPTEILVHLFEMVSISDLANLMSTCSQLRNLIMNCNTLWRHATRNLFLISDKFDNFNSPLSWFNRTRISHNWCKGIYQNKVILYHKNRYMPWIIYNHLGLLISLGYELRFYPNEENLPTKRFKWKLNVPKAKRKDIRTNDISRFIYKGKHIVCGNRDGCAAVYTVDSLKDSPILINKINDCHENGILEVTAVELQEKSLDEYNVITASNDSPHIKFWAQGNKTQSESDSNFIHYQEKNLLELKCCMRILMPACVGVRCLSLNDDIDVLAAGLNGNDKPMWIDVERGHQICNVGSELNTRQVVRDIKWHDNTTLTYVTHSGLLESVDIRSSETILSVREPFLSSLYCLHTDGERAILVGSSEYTRCVLFDNRKYSSHVQMYYTQKKSSPVYSLAFNTTSLIAAADWSVAVVEFDVAPETTYRRDYSHAFQLLRLQS